MLIFSYRGGVWLCGCSYIEKRIKWDYCWGNINYLKMEQRKKISLWAIIGPVKYYLTGFK
jgi:hypothetical protein